MQKPSVGLYTLLASEVILWHAIWKSWNACYSRKHDVEGVFDGKLNVKLYDDNTHTGIEAWRTLKRMFWIRDGFLGSAEIDLEELKKHSGRHFDLKLTNAKNTAQSNQSVTFAAEFITFEGINHHSEFPYSTFHSSVQLPVKSLKFRKKAQHGFIQLSPKRQRRQRCQPARLTSWSVNISCLLLSSTTRTRIPRFPLTSAAT